MFENERDEVRRNIMAMNQMGNSCSRLMDQTAEASTQLTMAMHRQHKDALVPQTTATSCIGEKMFARNSKKTVSNGTNKYALVDSSTEYSPSARSPSTIN